MDPTLSEPYDPETENDAPTKSDRWMRLLGECDKLKEESIATKTHPIDARNPPRNSPKTPLYFWPQMI